MVNTSYIYDTIRLFSAELQLDEDRCKVAKRKTFCRRHYTVLGLNPTWEERKQYLEDFIEEINL